MWCMWSRDIFGLTKDQPLKQFLDPGHGPEDIRRYPGHMTQDIAAAVSRVICPGYLLISVGHVANHQICRLITANNRIT